MREDKLSKAEASDLANSVQQLLQKMLTDLKGAAAAKGAGEARLFFPNGIELISLVVKVGPADVEVTIAGEKGVKPKSRSLQAIRAFDDSQMDVSAAENTEDIFRGQGLVWFNDGNQDVHVAFNTPDGCPLIPCEFTVPKGGGVLRTIVRNTVDAGEYHFTRAPAHVLADPKIIIQ